MIRISTILCLGLLISLSVPTGAAVAQQVDTSFSSVKHIRIDRPFTGLTIRRLDARSAATSSLNLRETGLRSIVKQIGDTVFISLPKAQQDNPDPGSLRLLCSDGLNIELHAGIGDLDVSGWNGNISADIEEGTAQLSGIQGNFSLRGETLDVIMTNVDHSNVSVRTQFGTVVHCKTPLRAGNYSLHSAHGDVQVFHYSSASYNLNAISDEGLVDVYIDGMQAQSNPASSASTAQGIVGTGEAALDLQSTDGFITIALDVAPSVNLQLPQHGLQQSPARRGAYFQAPHFFGCPCHSGPPIVPSLEN